MIRWRRDRLPTPVFLGFPCGSAGKESACSVKDLGSIPGLETSPGEEKGKMLQYSGLENAMDCIAHGVAKSPTRLSNFHFSLLIFNTISIMSRIPEVTPGCHCQGEEGKTVVLFPIVPVSPSPDQASPRFLYAPVQFTLSSHISPKPDTAGPLSPSSTGTSTGRTSATGAAWCTSAMLASASSACPCASASRIITGRARPLSVCVSMVPTLPSHQLRCKMDFPLHCLY